GRPCWPARGSSWSSPTTPSPPPPTSPPSTSPRRACARSRRACPSCWPRTPAPRRSSTPPAASPPTCPRSRPGRSRPGSARAVRPRRTSPSGSGSAPRTPCSPEAWPPSRREEAARTRVRLEACRWKEQAVKRFVLWFVESFVAVAWGGHALGVASADLRLDPLAASELEAVTGGRCIGKCTGDEPPEDDEEPIFRVGQEWRQVKRGESAAEQLSYSIHTALSNVYGTSRRPWERTGTDNCRHRRDTRGVGSSRGLTVDAGGTHRCASLVKRGGRVGPGWGVKVYKGDMGQSTTVTMALFDLYADGSAGDTGKRDAGRNER